jgi:hypothetical protein
VDEVLKNRALATATSAIILLLSLAGCSKLSFGAADYSKNNFKSDAAVLSELQSKLKLVTSSVARSSMDLWWVSADGLSIINDSSPAIEAQFLGCASDKLANEKWKTLISKIITEVDGVLLSNNFVVDNGKNSSGGLSDTRFYDYIRGYYRGTTKAVLSISPDCGSVVSGDKTLASHTAYFGYTRQYKKNYDSQSPYLLDLKLKNVIVHVQKSDGNYRLLAINYRRSGHATIVKRADGKWIELWSGQDLIECAVREKNRIPIIIAPDCF